MVKLKNKGTATKVICIAGTLLTWLPIAFTVLTSAVGTIATGRFHFDYLMPAELFPAAIAGAVLLLWAAWRSGLRFRMIGLSLVLAVLFLAGVMAIASLTGLATGETEPAGMPLIAVMSCLALYTVSLIAVGTGGILLWRDLYGARK
jgi:peptidoglycan/LPS O-acetylase OafA/YrhL